MIVTMTARNLVVLSYSDSNVTYQLEQKLDGIPRATISQLSPVHILLPAPKNITTTNLCKINI